MEPLSNYVKAILYTWRCACGFTEVVRLFLAPQIWTRTCPCCGKTAILTEMVVQVAIPEGVCHA